MGSKIKTIQILQAAGYILLGLFLVLKPDTSVRAICYGCGVIAAAYGLLHVLQCRKGKAKGELILGVIFIALGMFCLITPQTVVSFLPFLLGVVLMLDGISKIQRALDLRVLDAIGWASDDRDSFDDRWCGFAFQPIRGCEDDDGILRSLPADRRGTGFVIFAYRFVRCQGKKVQKSVFSCKKRHLTLTFLKFQECDL